MVDDSKPPPPVGWTRAILVVVGVVVVGIALVYGANAILTKSHGVNRHTLVGIVTSLFFVVLVALAWALRRLQRRNII